MWRDVIGLGTQHWARHSYTRSASIRPIITTCCVPRIDRRLGHWRLPPSRPASGTSRLAAQQVPTVKARQSIDGTSYGPEALKALDQAWSAGNIRAARYPATRRPLDRDAAFDAALCVYQHGGNPEGLLRAADAVIDSKIPIAPEHADRISEMTDQLTLRSRPTATPRTRSGDGSPSCEGPQGVERRCPVGLGAGNTGESSSP
jgi:hypothetical protein